MPCRYRAASSAEAERQRSLSLIIFSHRKFDFLVIGGGNAALCAAISARRGGASVLVPEAPPKLYRGGNTRPTRNMRCAHDSATDTLSGPYTEDEFLDSARNGGAHRPYPRPSIDPRVEDDASLGLLLARATPWMGPLLSAHLSIVLALFVTMPYGKFVHGVYRFLALVRYARDAPS